MQRPSAIADPEFIFRVKVIGSKNSGKSSLILKFTDHIFCNTSINTIGENFKSRFITIPHLSRSVKFQISDCQEISFRNFKGDNLKGFHAVFVAVDTTNRVSFSELQSYLQNIERYASENVMPIIVVTKFGEPDCEVNIDSLLKYCHELDLPVSCVNAKSGYNVEELFQNCAKLLINNIMNKENAEFIRESLIHNLESAITNFEHNSRHYRCLTFLHGQMQSNSMVSKLPYEVFNHIFSFVTQWQNKQKFIDQLYARKQRIDTKNTPLVEMKMSKNFYNKAADLLIQHGLYQCYKKSNDKDNIEDAGMDNLNCPCIIQ